MHHFTVAHVQRDKGGAPYSEDRYCASQQRERMVQHRNSVSVYPTDVSWK